MAADSTFFGARRCGARLDGRRKPATTVQHCQERQIGTKSSAAIWGMLNKISYLLQAAGPEAV